MDLTPIDIYNKEFSRVLRGYSQDEVDEFLDEVMETFERLYKENLDMKDALAAMKEQLDSYRTMEATLKETLVTAQQTADEVIETGQKKADLIIEQAEDRADKIVEEANREIIIIKKEYEKTKREMQVFKSRFKTLLNTQLEMLDAEKIDLNEEG